MAEPAINERLFELSIAVVREILERLEEEQRAGQKWLPKFTRRTVSTFQGGWPNIMEDSSDGCAAKPSSAFGFGRSNRTLDINFEELASTDSLVKYVLRDETLSAQFQTFPDLAEDDSNPARGELLLLLKRWEIFGFPLAIADRAAAVGDRSEGRLRSLYLELEAGRLADSLSFDLLVPIALLGFEFQGSLEIDGGVAIESIPDETQKARLADGYGIQAVPRPLIHAATHAIVVKSLSVANRPNRERKLNPFAAAREHLSLVDLCCEAVQTVTSKPVGYTQILIRPIGWADSWEYDLPSLQEVAVVRNYPSKFDNFGWLGDLTKVPEVEALRLPKIFKRLRSSPPQVKLAARRLSMAELRDADDDKVVDACIGLEALLGEGKDELTHRLSLRAAAVLATRSDRKVPGNEAYGLTRAVYSHRSSVVHGTVSRKHASFTPGSGSTISTVSLAIWLLRNVLLDRLEREPPWSPRDLDTLILSSLAATPSTSETAKSDGEGSG